MNGKGPRALWPAAPSECAQTVTNERLRSATEPAAGPDELLVAARQLALPGVRRARTVEGWRRDVEAGVLGLVEGRERLDAHAAAYLRLRSAAVVGLAGGDPLLDRLTVEGPGAAHATLGEDASRVQVELGGGELRHELQVGGICLAIVRVGAQRLGGRTGSGGLAVDDHAAYGYRVVQGGDCRMRAPEADGPGKACSAVEFFTGIAGRPRHAARGAGLRFFVDHDGRAQSEIGTLAG